MIVNTPGSQMGSPAVAQGRGEARWGGRGESGERIGVQVGSTLGSTEPKVRSRSREGATLDEVPRSSLRVSKLPSLASSSLWLVIGIVVVVIGHHSARTDIGMPVYDYSIRAYIGFLVDTVKARGGTTSRGAPGGAVIWCLTLRRQVVTKARWRRGRSRVNIRKLHV